MLDKLAFSVEHWYEDSRGERRRRYELVLSEW
jgi:hypothetical protein